MFSDDQVGVRIKTSRAHLGFSQAQLAELAEIAPAQLYRYESGRSTPRPEILGKLAAALDVSTEWLARGEGRMQREEQVLDKLPVVKGITLETVHLPTELLDWLKAQAESNKRTVEMEINFLVSEAMANLAFTNSEAPAPPDPEKPKRPARVKRPAAKNTTEK